MLEFKRQWVNMGKEYYLLVDTNGHVHDVPFKKFCVYDVIGASAVIATNKRLKEYDLLEYLKTKLKRKDIRLI